jgi:Helicase associated domain
MTPLVSSIEHEIECAVYEYFIWRVDRLEAMVTNGSVYNLPQGNLFLCHGKTNEGSGAEAIHILVDAYKQIVNILNECDHVSYSNRMDENVATNPPTTMSTDKESVGNISLTKRTTMEFVVPFEQTPNKKQKAKGDASLNQTNEFSVQSSEIIDTILYNSIKQQTPTLISKFRTKECFDDVQLSSVDKFESNKSETESITSSTHSITMQRRFDFGGCEDKRIRGFDHDMRLLLCEKYVSNDKNLARTNPYTLSEHQSTIVACGNSIEGKLTSLEGKADNHANSNRDVFTTKSNEQNRTWKQWFQRMVTFQRKYGHCNVGHNCNSGLEIWAANQRTLYRLRKLKPERIHKLDNIGFEWTIRDDDCSASGWDTYYKELVAFKNNNGHCQVAYRYHTGLGKWVAKQRSCYKEGRMHQDQVERLVNIGFEWNARTDTWEERYSKLVAFQERYGHCKVTENYNIGLARWVRNQRTLFKKGRLNIDRRQKLNAIGLEASIHQSVWDDRFQELIMFQKEHGHCNVTPRIPGQLSEWVANQRRSFCAGRLSQGHCQQLKSIGFEFRRKRLDETDDESENDEHDDSDDTH